MATNESPTTQAVRTSLYTSEAGNRVPSGFSRGSTYITRSMPRTVTQQLAKVSGLWTSTLPNRYSVPGWLYGSS